METQPTTSPAVDLLRWPVVGPMLRWRHSRTALQLLLLAVAMVVVIHGLFGPDLAAANLSTVLIWVHYRGLLVLALLAAANVFCAGCPFILLRDWGRRLHMPRLRWPHRLRGKWVAIALFALVLFAYELFDLWALPRATSFLVLGYFAAALVIDVTFKGASFCKHVCPVGQFNLVASTVSPLELRVRDSSVCQTCGTFDCIAGNDTTKQRGCELGLFLPRKVGNLDCTFCLDCVHACPHDNIGLTSRVPALELADSSRRSGIGRLTSRPDLAALVAVFVFGALLNAFAMTSGSRGLEALLSQATGVRSEAGLLAMIFVAGLVVAPALLLIGAAILTAALSDVPNSAIGKIVAAYVFGLVPFGCGLWLAHYGFHLLTGALVIVPVTQSAVLEWLGRPALGDPLWRWTGLRTGLVFPLQLGVIFLGATGSGALMYLIAERESPLRPGPAALPWVVLVSLLAFAALWTISLPMEMRGVGFGG